MCVSARYVVAAASAIVESCVQAARDRELAYAGLPFRGECWGDDGAGNHSILAVRGNELWIGASTTNNWGPVTLSANVEGDSVPN
jgi:hypothetical protein